MKKLIACALCAAMAFSFAACGSTSADTVSTKDGEKPSVSDNVQIPDPWTDCETLEEAEKLAGFDIIVPGSIEGYPDKTCRVLGGDEPMIEVIFSNGSPDDEDGYSELRIRKAPGDGDISGDYSTYAESSTLTAGEVEAEVRGNDGTISLAIWTNGGYTYSAAVSEGVSAGTIAGIITSVG